MNSDPTQNTSDPRDNLVEALLMEHARLGTASDEGLIATIRARTTEKPAANEPVVISEVHFGVRDWMKVAAAVTIALGLLWMVLPKGPVFESSDQEHTLKLVVIPQTSIETAENSKKQARLPELAPYRIPNYQALGSGVSAADLAASGLNSGMTFDGLESADLNLSTELLAEFSVSAEKIFWSNKSHRLVYQGDVVLKHPDFTLKADRLEMAASDRADERLVGSFMASGDIIEIDRLSASGAVESARARQVTYQQEGGALILEGAPSLSSGDSFVVPKSAAGMIVLRQDGYQVIESAPRAE